MKLHSLLAVAAVAVIGIQTMADTVFSQPGGFGAGQQTAGQASNVLGTYGQGEQVFADNFVLSSATSINSVSFWGWSDDATGFLAGGNRSDTENITGFVIEFFSLDMYRRPEVSLALQSIDLSAFTIEQDGTSWKYSVGLIAPIELAGGTEYGFSVSANLASLESTYSFLWEHAAVASDITSFTFGYGWYNLDHPTRGNMAFELYSTVIPLPPAVWLGGLGVLCIAVGRRRHAR